MTAQAGGASPSSPGLSPREARRRLRALRLELTPAARRTAESAIRRSLCRLGLWRPGRRVAMYLGMPGEVDLRSCVEDAWSRGTLLYVPVVLDARTGRMAFVPYEPGVALRPNRYGIEEPAGVLHRRVPVLALDTVLVPLVGFDARGHRIGMGAGYYDRALRRRLDRASAFRRPRLVGIAYALQQVGCIEPAPWDVALDVVVTEQGVLHCDRPPPEVKRPTP